MNRVDLPRLYGIADAGVLNGRGLELRAFAEGIASAGVRLVQYRDKTGGPHQVLAAAAEIRRSLGEEPWLVDAEVQSDAVAKDWQAASTRRCLLILNDRVDLALLAGFGGVHVGQEDLSPEDARAFALGLSAGRFTMGTVGARSTAVRARSRNFLVGVSAHTEAQVIAAEAGVADYVAIGPVFATGTKIDAAAVVGLEGVRRARALTTKPLVAIGGMTRANCRSVIEAGADSVAVISGLFADGESVERVARDFLEILR